MVDFPRPSHKYFMGMIKPQNLIKVKINTWILLTQLMVCSYVAMIFVYII